MDCLSTLRVSNNWFWIISSDHAFASDRQQSGHRRCAAAERTPETKSDIKYFSNSINNKRTLLCVHGGNVSKSNRQWPLGQNWRVCLQVCPLWELFGRAFEMEVALRRPFLWLPVAAGTGVVLYLYADANHRFG